MHNHNKYKNVLFQAPFDAWVISFSPGAEILGNKKMLSLTELDKL